jgi:hypothetical protein
MLSQRMFWILFRKAFAFKFCEDFCAAVLFISSFWQCYQVGIFMTALAISELAQSSILQIYVHWKLKNQIILSSHRCIYNCYLFSSFQYGVWELVWLLLLIYLLLVCLLQNSLIQNNEEQFLRSLSITVCNIMLVCRSLSYFDIDDGWMPLSYSPT